MIRFLDYSDLNSIVEIHQKFYKSEFQLPNLDQFLCLLASTDDEGKIITAGGLRPILEAIAITDKDKPVKARKRALVEMLQAMMFLAGKSNYQQIHAFIQDDKWSKHLKKYGFKTCNGEALYLNVEG